MESTEGKDVPLTPEKLERYELWGKMANELSRIKDLDEGILKLVIGLNVVGIKTHSSCEGHNDRLYEEAGNYYQHWEPPYVSFRITRLTYKEYKEITALRKLISEFNTDREEQPGYELIVTGYDKGVAAQLRPGFIGRIGVPETNNMRLDGNRLAYKSLAKQKREMYEFGKFLKEKYLETGFRV